MKRTLLRILIAAAVFLGGYAAAQRQSYTPARASTVPMPKSWGQVRAALGEQWVTLVLEDEAGTIRVVTLDRTMNQKGEASVTPRVYAVVERE